MKESIKMTSPQHYIGRLCDCGNRNVIAHTPTRIAMKRDYDPKGVFVPAESILDDYTETSKLNSSSSSSEISSICCCIHGAACASGSRKSLSSRRSSCSSNGSRRNESEYQNLGYVSTMKKCSNENISNPCRDSSYYAKVQSPSATDKAYEKVRIDQNIEHGTHSIKTRWPLVELIAEMSHPMEDRTSPMENIPRQSGKEIYYDCYSDYSEKDTKSLGRRKNKKKKCFKDNEKYPKLESVLEDTGYIELKVSSSKESSRRSNGPKSCRRKNKKSRHNHL